VQKDLRIDTSDHLGRHEALIKVSAAAKAREEKTHRPLKLKGTAAAGWRLEKAFSAGRGAIKKEDAPKSKSAAGLSRLRGEGKKKPRPCLYEENVNAIVS